MHPRDRTEPTNLPDGIVVTRARETNASLLRRRRSSKTAGCKLHHPLTRRTLTPASRHAERRENVPRFPARRVRSRNHPVLHGSRAVSFGSRLLGRVASGCTETGDVP
jgi:hypothetical protein